MRDDRSAIKREKERERENKCLDMQLIEEGKKKEFKGYGMCGKRG